MISMNRKVCAVILGMLIMLAAVTPADAQWRRYRDRGTSTKEKAAWIGGGAAAGAVVGGLLNGRTGAVIGGLLGAGAGTGVAVLRDRNNNNDRWDRYEGRRYYRGGNSGYYNSGNYGYYNSGSRFVGSRFIGNNRFGGSSGRRCR